MIIGDALNRCVNNYPDKLAFKDEYGKFFSEGISFSYRELNQTVNCLANNLLSLGLQKGDRVAVQTGTGTGAFISLLALLKAGLATAPIDRTFMQDEIIYQIGDSGAKAFIVDTDIYSEKIAPVRQELPSVKHFIGIGEPDVCKHHFQTLMEKGSSREPDVRVEESDIATLIYTSGTTGRPKGVPLTHKNWMTSVFIWTSELSIHPYTRWALLMPLHTSGGTGLSLVSACRGCSLTVANPDPEKILHIIENDRITFTQFSPTLLAMILQHPNVDTTDFSHIEGWFTSAAPISAELLSRGAKYLGSNFTQLYGTSETALLGTVMRPQEVSLEGVGSERLTSIGRACLGYEAKVVDNDGNAVGPGGIGEIAIRGDAVVKGYWNRPEQDDFKDGWWHSGDVVRIDQDGFYYVVDRKKDMILSGGNNVYPREVEDVISRHPAVNMVAVIGVPSEKWGEEVKAVIVPKNGADVTETEIIEFCREHMASYKKPKSVDFISFSEMPTSGGSYKILKRVLKERY
ncbi:Acyl-CoA synthetase (AMP-forming)/AMP-acid ligase II [Desulfosarcina cetonica]|uniref:class I adenylate-forming enzyme family protein n=1 Tax=Desulfosarcina cetonica TaxID=90730 RepID=UPI0006D11678|nr:AMP-binding protein [Desulfosarcina cetonica]VTR70272.1 Acyl-CoA synthetase (AMP-forming)/AMP-acid ligase II [Desulfosarcina cetonica]